MKWSETMRLDSLPVQLGFLAAITMLSGCLGNIDVPDDAQGVVDRPGVQTPDDDSSDDAAVGDPEVALTASRSVVGTGETVTLTWTGTNVSSCEASGGWSGSRGTSGSASVGPLSASTTFSITCSGASGSAMSMISVAVRGVVTLSWQPPTENVDGSPLSDLSGYQIYYGTESRDYDAQVAVSDPRVTQQSLELTSGTYYLAVTAIDDQGNESGYSNEVTRTID
jgi:hypothetical protein